MNLTVNGTRHEVEEPQSVSTLLTTLRFTRRDVAVAVEGRMVPRTRWTSTQVVDGAVVEVVTAVQGG